jgi:nicotinate-nucleotide adenylyltransferase
MSVLQKPTTGRIGFFGGTFDPPHIGHVSIAKQAINEANLDNLVICPAYHAPLRHQQPILPVEVRVKMLELIASENDKINLSTIEIEQQKTCYTYNTLLKIREQFPSVELKVILGTDQFEKLTRWKHCEELASICQFLVFARHSHQLSPPSITNLSYQLMNNELIDCSSTEIRNRIKNNQSIEEMIPDIAYPTFKKFLSN